MTVFFKRLFAICTNNAEQHTEIAANAEESYALQKSKMKETGIATSIFDAMLQDADSRIFQKRRMRNFRHQVNVRCSDSRYERKVQGNHALGSCI